MCKPYTEKGAFMRGRPYLLFASSIVILFSIAMTAFSQASVSVAQLNGTVKDEAGGVVVNVSVNLRDLETNRLYTSSSNDAGYYVIPNLPPGRYELKIESPGFSVYQRTGL